jgi:hypothetical protein
MSNSNKNKNETINVMLFNSINEENNVRYYFD